MWAAIAPHARRSGTFFVGLAPVFLATVNPLGKESSTVFVERTSPLLWGARRSPQSLGVREQTNRTPIPKNGPGCPAFQAREGVILWKNPAHEP
ncbi:MAG: hypothetical protein RLZZ326_521 [Planctomycetota bacterium]|jgi:hypothetical protein